MLCVRPWPSELQGCERERTRVAGTRRTTAWSCTCTCRCSTRRCACSPPTRLTLCTPAPPLARLRPRQRLCGRPERRPHGPAWAAQVRAAVCDADAFQPGRRGRLQAQVDAAGAGRRNCAVLGRCANAAAAAGRQAALDAAVRDRVDDPPRLQRRRRLGRPAGMPFPGQAHDLRHARVPDRPAPAARPPALRQRSAGEQQHGHDPVHGPRPSRQHAAARQAAGGGARRRQEGVRGQHVLPLDARHAAARGPGAAVRRGARRVLERAQRVDPGHC